ncbi:hypothetical protein [Legionella nagasakiensis]|uniref:hypothetical protein n=1 Tax=Legionella nagasakiensis TaxID=535290 RepID=UPI001056635C|nr:hypothetical protein [Legionella nagasakiensis]
MTKTLSEDQQQALLQQLIQMQEPIHFKAEPQKRRSKVLTNLRQLPLVSDIGHHIAESGVEVTHLSEIEGVFRHTEHTAKSLSSGFHLAALVFGVIDFVRIPAIYLSSWMMGESIPVSLSKNARWFYASALIGLAITALAVPVAAMPIALAGAFLGLGVSLLSLGKFYYRKIQLQEELIKVMQELAEKGKVLSSLQKEASETESHLRQAFDEGDVEKIKTLSAGVIVMQQEFDTLKAQLQILHGHKAVIEKKQLKRRTLGFVDKVIGVGLASLTVIGVVLSLFSPPVGVGILAASAIAGGAYILGRATYPIAKKWWQGRSEKLESTSEKKEIPPSMKNEHESFDSTEENKPFEEMNRNFTEPEKIHESTSDFMQQLGLKETILPHEQIQENDKLVIHRGQRSLQEALADLKHTNAETCPEEEDSREGEAIHL